MTYISNKDPQSELAKLGNIWRGLGEKENLGVEVNGEDIWRGNELTPAPTSVILIPTPNSAGEAMSFVSESINDAAAGTGVQEVTFECLDASGNELQIVKATNGTTPVSLGVNVSFINDMYSSAVGSNGVAADNIKVYKTADSGLVYNMIVQGGNKSLVPHRKIPTGKYLILKGWQANEAQGKRVTVRIRSTDMYGILIAGVFCFKGTVYLNKNTSGELKINEKIPSLSIIKISAWGDATASEASCSWWGELYDN